MKTAGLNVLSLFDGMSCGQIALERAGIKVNQYFASEIDKPAISVCLANYPNTIQLGDVTKVFAKDLPKIDLIIGGSPCQGFSFAGAGLNFNDPRSSLFFEFVRLVNECKKVNPDVKYLLENVNMKREYLRVISEYLGVFPVNINSNLVSAQNRNRWYWSNIKTKQVGLFSETWTDIPQPEDKKIFIKDIVQPENEVNKKYYLKFNVFVKKAGVYNVTNQGKKINNEINKSTSLLAREYKGFGNQESTAIIIHNAQPRSGDLKKSGTSHLSRNDGKTYCLDTGQTNAIELNSRIRRLTPIECERLQTVSDNYTNHVSDTQRYKMLGNGWTIDIITHILNHL